MACWNRLTQLKIVLVGVFGIIIFLFLCQSAIAEVLIIQVLYDPLKTESGGEFVLLENNGNATISLAGWTLASASSNQDVVFPKTMVIGARQKVLIADKGWNQSRDNLSWPLADLESTMTLANSNSGVALLQNGTLIDAVGWGNVSNPLLFKGSPAKQVQKGHALVRIATTGSNHQDFAESIPFFGEQNTTGGADIEIIITEPDQSRAGFAVSIEDDDPRPGIQIIPFPGANRLVRINVSSQGWSFDEIRAVAWGTPPVEVNSSINNSGKEGRLVIPLPYHTLPGNYSVLITLKEKGVVRANHSFVVEIEPVLSISLDSQIIRLGNAKPGDRVVLKGDQNPKTPESATLWNSGNVKAGLTAWGSELVFGENKIPVSSASVSLRGLRSHDKEFSFDTTPQDTGIGFEVGDVAGLDISFFVPALPPGTYRGKVWVLAEPMMGGKE